MTLDIKKKAFAKLQKPFEINKQKNELMIFSKKKNAFLAQVWGQDFKNVKTYKNLRSIENENLICSDKQCTFKNIFTFDLDANLFLNNNQINTAFLISKSLPSWACLKLCLPYRVF